MAESASQNYKNHQKFVPMYHYVAAAIVLLNLVWWTYRTLTAFSMDHVVLMVLGFGVILVGFFARFFPNKNQDRIIRLEERMRFEELLPDDLKEHVTEYTTAQLIALRFASDAELPELARRVRDEKIESREDIKKMVKNWRADHHRV